MYRVSSRSFPNRQAVDNDGTLAIVPRPGFEGDLNRNPYIAYNALRIAGDWAIAPTAARPIRSREKISGGMSPREALVISLIALGL